MVVQNPLRFNQVYFLRGVALGAVTLRFACWGASSNVRLTCHLGLVCPEGAKVRVGPTWGNWQERCMAAWHVVLNGMMKKSCRYRYIAFPDRKANVFSSMIAMSTRWVSLDGYLQKWQCRNLLDALVLWPCRWSMIAIEWGTLIELKISTGMAPKRHP